MPPKRKAATKSSAGPSVPVPRTLPELEQVLRSFLGGNPMEPGYDPTKIDDMIRAATSTLREFIKLPPSVPALISRIAMKDSAPDTRQLACVLLCKNIQKFWAGLQKSHMLGPGKSDAEQCREHIMTILHSGDAPAGLIHTLSFLCATIARMDLPKGRFQQLPEWVVGALQSPNPSHVDAALRIAYNVLLSRAGEKLSPYYDRYLTSFMHWISNPATPIIRHRALLALHGLLTNIHEEDQQTKAMIGIIPVLIQIINVTAQNLEYESLKQIAQLLSNFYETPTFEQFSLPVVQALYPVILNTEVDVLVRLTVAQCLADYVQSYPLLMSTSHTMPDGTTTTLLQVFSQIIIGLYCEEDDDAFNVEETQPHKVGGKILEELFKYLPREVVYEPFPAKIVELLQSPNSAHRKGGYILIMMCSEHCPMQLAVGEKLQFNGQQLPLLNIALEVCCQTILTEQVPIVFSGICHAISKIMTDLGQYISNHNLFQKPLEVILQCLDANPRPENRKLLMYVLDSLCETAEGELVPHLARIMQHIGQQLSMNDVEQQESAIKAISSVAFGVNDQFAPYFPQLLPMFEQIANAPETPETLPLREAAFIAISACARAVGIGQWVSDVRDKLFAYIKIALDAILLNNGERNLGLISHYLIFLGNVGVVLAELPELNPEVLSMLAEMYNACVEILRSLEGVHFYNKNIDAPKLAGFDGESDDDEPKSGQANGADDDEDEDDLDDDDEQYYFDQVAIEAKGSALGTLSLLVSALGPKIYQLPLKQLFDPSAAILHDQIGGEGTDRPSEYLPMDPVMRLQTIVIEQIHYMGDQCSDQQYELLGKLLLDVLLKVHPVPKTPGVKVPLPPQILQSTEPILRVLYGALIEVEEDVVAAALEQLCLIVSAFGISVFTDEKDSEEFYAELLELVAENAPCFYTNEYKDERADQGDYVLEQAGALIGELAGAFGPTFSAHFLKEDDVLLNLMTTFCGPTRPATFRAVWIGCLAEILERTGSSGQEIVVKCFPLALALLQDDNQAVNHNALFFSSECARSIRGRQDLIAQIPADSIQQMFNCIIKHFNSQEQYFITDDKEFHDNAVSASLSFVLTFPTIIPATLLPNILAVFPLCGDVQEVVKIVLDMPLLYTQYTEIMKPFTGKVVAQIAMLLHYGYHDHCRDVEPTIVQFAKQLIQQFPQEAQTAPQYLQEHHQSVLPALHALAQ